MIQGEAKPAAKVWNDEEIGGDEKENDVSGAEVRDSNTFTYLIFVPNILTAPLEIDL